MKNKTPQELGKELVESSAVAGAVKREANAFKRGSFTTLITIFLAIFTSSQATEGKCKIKEIVNYSYVHECEMDNGGICSYTGRDETTITCNF